MCSEDDKHDMGDMMTYYKDLQIYKYMHTYIMHVICTHEHENI